MVTSTSLLAAPQKRFSSTATQQPLHSQSHSRRAVIFITIITPMSSFYKHHFLLMSLSGLVFSWAVTGGKGKKKTQTKKISCVVPPSSSPGKETGDLPPKKHHLCQEQRGLGSSIIASALVATEGCPKSTWQLARNSAHLLPPVPQAQQL